MWATVTFESYQLCERCADLVSFHYLAHSCSQTANSPRPTVFFCLSQLGTARELRWRKPIKCPTRSGLLGAVRSFHRCPFLNGVYKGHMAWGGGAVPALPTLTRKAALPPGRRKWTQCVAGPAVPGDSGWGETRQHWLTSLHSSERHLDSCRRAAPLALPDSDRGPVKNREAGRLWGCRSEWNRVQHTHRNYRDEDKKVIIRNTGYEDGTSDGNKLKQTYNHTVIMYVM